MAQAPHTSNWPPGPGEMARLIRAHAWAATPLGPVENWPQSLRVALSICLGSRTPIALYWGEELLLLYNDAARQLIGDRHPQALGRPMREAFPEVWPAIEPMFHEVLATGEATPASDALLPLESEGRLEDRWFDFSYNPITGEDGRVEGIFNIALETTERVRAERRQAFLLRLSDALRPLADPMEIQTAAARLLGQHLGANQVHYGETLADTGDEATTVVHQGYGDGLPPMVGTFRHRADGWGERLLATYRAGRTAVSHNVDADPTISSEEAAIIGGAGIRAYVAVPLVKAGAYVAVLAVHSIAPRHWTPDEIALVEETAARTWAAVEQARAEAERTRAEAELRQSEERFRAIVETARDYGIFTTDPEGRIETWPPGAQAVYGWPPDEAIGMPVDLTFTPEDRIIDAPETERLTARTTGLAMDVRWHLRRDGSRVFIDGVNRPLKRDDGSLVGFVKVGQDVTERHRAEEQLQLATEAAELGIFDVDLATGAIAWDARIRALWGIGTEEVVTDATFLAGVHPDDRKIVQSILGQALDPEGNRLYQAEYRVRHRETGRECWVAARGRVHFDGLRPLRFVGTVHDVTERRHAEAALRESEARFRQFGDASADVLWIRDAKTLAFEYVSPAWEEIYGTPREHRLGHDDVCGWADLILPEDRTLALDHLRRVQAGEHVLSVFRIQRSDGQVRWIRDTGFPIVDDEGRVQRVAGIGHDATEQVELQERLKVLVAELQHRSRNLVSVVNGVTERTLATSETLEDFRTRIRARLAALGRVNALLSRLEEGDRITFDQLLDTELQAHGVLGFDGQGEQVHASGPKGIRLRSATVQTFALALHELATNALKYGALSRPEGRLDVTWSLVPGKEGTQRLRVDWRETGVPLDGQPGSDIDGAPMPRRQGYGRELIERALPYQLRAQTRYELTPEGVRCTIVLPVSSTFDLAFSSEGETDSNVTAPESPSGPPHPAGGG